MDFSEGLIDVTMQRGTGSASHKPRKRKSNEVRFLILWACTKQARTLYAIGQALGGRANLNWLRRHVRLLVSKGFMTNNTAHSQRGTVTLYHTTKKGGQLMEYLEDLRAPEPN